MENKETIDFYKLGQICANDTLYEIKSKAVEYGKKFGANARSQFEIGIASVISEYSKVEIYEGEKVDQTSRIIDENGICVGRRK